MNTIDAIKTRISTRQFTDQPITDEAVHTILEAGMSGPTAVNARPWSFIVIRDKATLDKLANSGGRPCTPLMSATMAILVCGDAERFFKFVPDFWVVDASIAAQNMILAAHDMGVGSVWLGCWPAADRMQAFGEALALPEGVIPHSLIAFGYPQEPSTKQKLLYEEDRVHFEQW